MMFLFNFLLEGICITAFIYILLSLALSSKGKQESRAEAISVQNLQIVLYFPRFLNYVIADMLPNSSLSLKSPAVRHGYLTNLLNDVAS